MLAIAFFVASFLFCIAGRCIFTRVSLVVEHRVVTLGRPGRGSFAAAVAPRRGVEEACGRGLAQTWLRLAKSARAAGHLESATNALGQAAARDASAARIVGDATAFERLCPRAVPTCPSPAVYMGRFNISGHWSWLVCGHESLELRSYLGIGREAVSCCCCC